MLIKRITYYINNIKIRNKLIFIYVVVALLPVLFVGMYMSNNMKNMVVSQALIEADTNTERINYRFSEVAKIISNVSDSIYIDKRLQENITTNYSNKIEVMRDISKFSSVYDLISNFKDIQFIRLYTNNYILSDNSQWFYINDEIKNMPWYNKTIDYDGRQVWQFIRDEVSGNDTFCVSRVIKGNTQKVIGVMKIILNNLSLYSIVKDEPYDSFITLNDGTIITAKQQELIGSKLNINKKEVNVCGGYGEKINRTYNLNDYRLVTNQMQKNDSAFNICVLVPILLTTQKANMISMLSFIIIGSALLVSFVLILVFTLLLSKRIIRLKREMQKIVLGDFDTVVKMQGKDEIGELFLDLNIMKESLKRLINEVYQERIQKEILKNKQKEAEFKMLASQINPHFLYNTLETIRMKAYCNHQTDIANAVKYLAKIMRRNLEVKDSNVTLESELEAIISYLEIQKFRFGDRINFSINRNYDINHYCILPLLLQPIVENAFVHGLESKEGSGNISVNINKSGLCLIISVVDDGVGMEEDELNKINKRLSNYDQSDGKNIGISNVNQRIKLYYGEEYGLKIESKINVGTTVEIILPLYEKEGIVCYDY